MRALVLDSVLDPARYARRRPGLLGSVPFLRVDSDVGAVATMRQFFHHCAQAGPACAFSAGGDPEAKFAALAKRLGAHPLPVSIPGRTVSIGYAELVFGAVNGLYQVWNWQRLAGALQDLYTSDGRAFAALLPAPGETLDEPLQAIVCADTDNPRTPGVFPRIVEAAEERAPYGGQYWGYPGQACANWPRDGDRYLGPWNRRTSAPVLIIGIRYDPATAYHNAVALSATMPRGRLLTLDGWGHATLLTSRCVDRAVDRYLINGVLPDHGAVCSSDVRPFGPPPSPPRGRNPAGVD